MIANRHPAGKPRLRCDHHMLSDIAVMPDVYQIVELAAIADASHAQRRPVDTGIGANFHIVADLYRPHLRKLIPPPLFIRGEPKTIGSDHATAMQNRALSN
jgi:hypothetical protein